MLRGDRTWGSYWEGRVVGDGWGRDRDMGVLI